MTKRDLWLFVMLACLTPGGTSRAAAPVPVWEYLISQGSTPIPVLTNTLNDVTDSDEGNGRSVIDSLSALKRYDANRLLLGIRENGVNESAPNLNEAQRWVATNYPDRSLIWINPSNGQPMGIALTVGLQPVALEDWYRTGAIAAGGSSRDWSNQFYWSFEVSADGCIYTGYKHKILRYRSNGAGGISPVPEVAFTLSPGTATVHGNLYAWAGRFPFLRVCGTGTNTVILAGGLSADRGAYRLTTPDGTNFVATSWLPSGVGFAGSGSFSSLIPAPQPPAPAGEEWTFGGWYPLDSDGLSGFCREATQPAYADPANNFNASTNFSPQADPSSVSNKYLANFIGGVDARADLDYIVAYSTPSYDSLFLLGTNTPPRPGWLAVHDKLTGRFIASRLLDVRESDALLTADHRAQWHATYGYVTMDRLADGDVEVLWSSPVYGYGRYLMQTPRGVASIMFAGGVVRVECPAPGQILQLQRTVSLSAADWQNVGPVVSGGNALFDTAPPPRAAFYRVLAVAAPPAITRLEKAGGVVTILFQGEGNSFQLQRCTDLRSASWQNIGPALSAGATAADSAPPPGYAFYRIVRLN